MGMDLIGTTYVTIISGTSLPSPDEAKEALRRALFSLPDEKLDAAADYWSWIGDDDEEEDTFSDALLGHALTGWQDALQAIGSGHRFHTVVAEGDEFYITWAGGGSWGDDPYEEWNDLCIFLWVIGQSPDLVPIFSVDSDISKYLKPLKDVS